MSTKCNIERPLLADSAQDEELHLLKFPVYVSPKLDGIRCLIINGKAVSRKFEPIPNQHIVKTLEKVLPDGMDGELMVRGKETSFNAAQSGIMTEDGLPDFVFHIFDYVKDSLDRPFSKRLEDLKEWYSKNKHKLSFGGEAEDDEDAPIFRQKTDEQPFVELVPQLLINSVEELLQFEKECFEKGYEGAMIRSPEGVYKCNRSTFLDGILLKRKRWVDSEMRITGFEEQKQNTNKQEKNELGLSKRSSHKDGKVGKGTLGKILGVDIHHGWDLKIATVEGMTKQMRQEIWDNPEKYLNKIMTYKYQKEGMKNKPRIPIGKGFRDERDMS